VEPSLEVWIEQLRDRLERGELAGRGPIMLLDGSRFPTTELAVKILLADLAHLAELPPDSSPAAVLAERRQQVLNELQHLRGQMAT